MIKSFSLLTVLSVSSMPLWAENTTSANAANNNLLIITFVLAALAFLIAAINAYRISHLKKISEVDLINQKDDLNVSMEAVKVDLYRDIRNIRRELGKLNRPPKPAVQQKPAEPKADKTETSAESIPVEKKPYRKRPSNFKRRPPRKKEGDSNSATEV